MNYIDTQDLTKYSIKAQDGDIGKVTDFYFDESLFYLRYLVVDTKPFLLRNLVLVSPVSFHKIDSTKKMVDVYITKKELENSPSLDAAEPVSRQFEKAYNDYFAWPYYWGTTGTSAWAIGPYGIPWGYYDQMDREIGHIERQKDLVKDARNNGLRSAKEVQSYEIKGIDDNFGQIKSFILDPKTLSIDFIVVDTIKFIPSKSILLRPEWVEDISWETKTVTFPLFKELIKSAPQYKKGELTKSLIRDNDNHFKEALTESPKTKLKTDKNKDSSEKSFVVKNNRAKLTSVPGNKAAVGDIPSGLFVVTVEDPSTKKIESFLASWVQQASFDPLLISVCIKDGRPGLDAVLNNSPFCVNVVSKDKTDYITHFKNRKNSSDSNPLRKIPHQQIKGKGAILDRAKSAMFCKPHEIYHPGDHYIVTAEVTEGMTLNTSATPKTYVRRSADFY